MSMKLGAVKRGAGLALILLLAAGGLSACGKKAMHVSPPDDVDMDTFPRSYPDPKTDPKPESSTPPSATPSNPASNAMPTDITPAQ